MKQSWARVFFPVIASLAKQIFSVARLREGLSLQCTTSPIQYLGVNGEGDMLKLKYSLPPDPFLRMRRREKNCACPALLKV